MSEACILARNTASKQGKRMSEERFIDLESRLAHQDQLLNELNEVVTGQQAKITQLDELCQLLLDRIRSLADAMPAGSAADERPPHF